MKIVNLVVRAFICPPLMSWFRWEDQVQFGKSLTLFPSPYFAATKYRRNYTRHDLKLPAEQRCIQSLGRRRSFIINNILVAGDTKIRPKK
jgi:hypothetical protein